MTKKENGYVLARRVVEYLELQKKFYKTGKVEYLNKMHDLEDVMTQDEQRQLQTMLKNQDS